MTKAPLLLALGALALAPVASAQTRFEAGAGYNFDAEAAFIGAGARIPMRTYPITLAPHVDYYFVDDVTVLQGNIDGLYSFPGVSFSPYVGGGLGLVYATADGESDTEAGLNLLFGAEFNTTSRLRPYAQVRATINDGTSIGVSGGVIF